MAQRREKGTGSVYRDPKNPKRWIGEISLEGKRRRVSGPSKTVVRARLKALLAASATGDLPKHQISVAQAVEIFIARKLPELHSNGQPLAPSTAATYKWAAGIIIEELGSKRLHHLTIEEVEAMLDRLSDRGFSRASLHKIRSKLAQFIDEARRRRHVRENVARDAVLPSSATRTQPRKSLTPKEAKLLLTVLKKERNGAMFALSLTCGLRPGEAAGLYWDDLDLDSTPPTVNVTRGVRRDGTGFIQISDELKTQKSKRTIELTVQMVEWLKNHRRDQLKEKLSAEHWLDHELVFTSPTGHITDPARNRKLLRQVCDEAKITHVSPNELRHSCASLLSDQGVANELIADLLGHTTTRMVDSTYRHRLRPVVSVAAQADWIGRDQGPSI